MILTKQAIRDNKISKKDAEEEYIKEQKWNYLSDFYTTEDVV